MASPNTGLFASSFIDGFLKQQQSQKDRLNKNKIIKLQTKLIEQQLLAGTIKADATTTLMEALAGRPAIDTPGDIGPDEFGPPKSLSGREPVGLAELLTNPEALTALIQSGQLNISDLIGKQQQPTSFTREAQAAGISPGSPEFKEAFLAKNRAGSEDQALQQIFLGIQEEKQLKAKAEREANTEKGRQQRVKGRIAVRNHFALAKEAIALQKDLFNTALQSGIPAGDFLRDIQAGAAALAKATGFNLGKAQEIVDKRDRLKKLYAVRLVSGIEGLRGTGTITNQKLFALNASLPTLANSPVANAQLLGDQMQAALDGADLVGIKVPNREEIEAFIADPLAGLESQSGPIVDVPAIARMSVEQLNKLDLQGMGEDALRAASGRLRQLNAR